jgi:hypothetical protein
VALAVRGEVVSRRIVIVMDVDENPDADALTDDDLWDIAEHAIGTWEPDPNVFTLNEIRTEDL